MSAVAVLERESLRRSYDRLQVARVLARSWSLPAPEARESASWPFLALAALSGGASIRHGELRRELAEGELCVLRNRADLEVASPEGAELLLMRIPETAVGPHGAVLDAAHGSVWSAANGTASLVGHLLQGLAAQIDDYVPGNPVRLAEHIVGLVVLMCSDGFVPDGSTHPGLLAKAKEHIEARLGDVELSPDRIAAALNVSTRTLHRLFESQGLTISGWIRARRLEHCRADLVDRNMDASSVSRIGTRWGLWDAAHFSRLFKASYGLSPRAYRLLHAHHDCDESCMSAGAAR